MNDDYIDINIDDIILVTENTDKKTRPHKKTTINAGMTGKKINLKNAEHESEYINVDYDDLFIGKKSLNDMMLELDGGGLYDIFFCRGNFPLMEDISEPKEIIHELYPSNVFGHNAYKKIIKMCVWMSKLQQYVSYDKYVETAIRIANSKGVSSESLGMGCDVLVNFIFTIMKSLIMMTKIIATIDQTTSVLTDDERELIHNTIPDEYVENQTEEYTSTQLNTNAIYFLRDLLNIDFHSGPSGVKCWIRRIFMKHEGKIDNETQCVIARKLYPIIVQFIANLIGTSIPTIGSSVTEFIIMAMTTNEGKKVATEGMLGNIEKQYMKISKNMRAILENPNKLSNYMTKNYTTFQEILHYLFNNIDDEPTEDEIKIADDLNDDNEQETQFLNEQEIYEQLINTSRKNVPPEIIESNDENLEGGIFAGIAMMVGKKVAKKAIKKTINEVKNISYKSTGPMLEKITTVSGVNIVFGGKLRSLDKVVSVVIDNSQIIAFTLHKMLALSFTILYLIKNCKL